MSGPVITPVPDHIQAFHTYWRQQTQLTTVFPGLEIRGAITSDVPSFSWFLSAQKSGGGNEEDNGILYRPRVDVKCYAPDPFHAMELWRYVHPTLRSGFTANNCRILNCILEVAPISLEEPDDRWPFVLAVYRPYVLMVPV